MEGGVLPPSAHGVCSESVAALVGELTLLRYFHSHKGSLSQIGPS